MKDFKKRLSLVLGCLAAVCLAAAAAIAVRHGIEEKHGRETLNQLRDAAAQEQGVSPVPSPAVTDPAAQEQTERPEVSLPPATEEPAASPQPTPALGENPYRDAYAANQDMAAWLQIPGTDIDYPVMWTPEDENYYLRRGFDGSSDKNGCLILDTDSCLDPLTTNLIIHGHNMRSGTMFGHLADYEDEAFCRNHSTILLNTPQCLRRYEVIAVFRSQVYKKSDDVFKYYKFFQADTQEEFDDFYSNILALSLYDTGVTAEFGDHFLTLSTCSYHVDRGRFVVVAKETEPDEYYLPLPEQADPETDDS